MDDCFGPRLRRERERRKISLESISANTKINVSLFEGLERDDVSRWPSGIFRRSFVRAYAEAIGLDPDETVQQFAAHFPDPAELAEPFGARQVPEVADRPVPNHGLRLVLDDMPTPFSAGPLLSRVRERWAAIAVDVAVVLSIAVMIFLVLNAFWMPLAVSSLLYYTGGILALGNTPGVCLLANRPHAASEPAGGAAPAPLEPLDALEVRKVLRVL